MTMLFGTCWRRPNWLAPFLCLRCLPHLRAPNHCTKALTPSTRGQCPFKVIPRGCRPQALEKASGFKKSNLHGFGVLKRVHMDIQYMEMFVYGAYSPGRFWVQVLQAISKKYWALYEQP